MSSFKPKTLWAAEPHTCAKLAIVERYLYTWFQILGRSGKWTRLAYVDGFAGPGEYTNLAAGSPIVALDCAVKVLSDAKSGLLGKELRFYFVEKEPWVANHLEQKLKKRVFPAEIGWKVHRGSFEEHFASILSEVRQAQVAVPIFAFIDPFGATGLPFRAVADILASPTCEVLINLDSDGVLRLVKAAELHQNADHLDALFGDPGWREEINPELSLTQKCAQVLGAYKKRLRALPNVRFCFAFTMNDKPGKLNYHLVFAGQNSKGLEKMKEAMKRIDQEGDYSFADTVVGQPGLRFNFNDPGPLAQKMHAAFVGRTVPLQEVQDYVLNETPFIQPFPVLEWIRKRKLLERECFGEAVAHGYPADKVKAIRFLADPSQGQHPQLTMLLV